MKKLIIITGILVLLPLFANAQFFSFGIKGGVNLASLNIDGSDENNLITGLNLGVLGRIMVTENIGFQPEIIYSAKGVHTVYSRSFLGFDIANGETKLRINYIDVPLYLVVFPIPNFDIHLGPYVSFLMNSNIDTQTEILDFINVDNEDDVDRSDFNELDAGVSAGMAFSFEFLTLGLNYSLGLREVAREGESMENLLGEAKNNSFQIYLGLIF